MKSSARLTVLAAFPTDIFLDILVRALRALSNTAASFFVQEVAIFTGQALISMATKAGLAVGGALPAPLLVSMEVARRAAGDTDSGVILQLIVVV